MSNSKITTDKSTVQNGAGNSSRFPLPDNVGQDVLRRYAISIVCKANGTAKIQMNNTPLADIIASPDDNWEDWNLGDQVLTVGNAKTDTLSYPVTALRLVVTGGNFEMHVRGHLN